MKTWSNTNDEPAAWTALCKLREDAAIDSRLTLFSYQITLHQPNKTDVVPFLDDDAKEPARYARATVSFGGEDLHWQEYLVGPLSGTNSTNVEPLTYPFHNEQPGKTRIHAIYALQDATLFQLALDSEVSNITKALWNTTISEGTVFLRYGVPFWEEDGRLVSWASFIGTPLSDITSLTLLPLGVWVKFDFTSRNWTEWTTEGWYSQGKFYENTADFEAAVFSSDYQKPPPNIDGNWTSTDRQGELFPLDEKPPPVSSQASQRFVIDDKEGYICWMDFCFYTAVAWDVGLSLFDIQYKGKRLIYELSLQEALTAYAGSDPFASQTTFWDTITGLGSTLVPLVRGYDCPAHATYLNATFADRNSTITQTDAICVFEYDAGYPIRRHSSLPIYTSVARNIVFTIRTISTVGNYDFMIEYNFFYDGAIEVSVRASGYISATYWEGNLDYGSHIHDYLSGSLHDHVLTFKADFDVLGTKNTLQKVEFVPESTEYPWSQGKVHNTFKATRSFITNESEASIDWSANDAAIYAIANTESPNRFGEFQAYRIKRSAGTTHLTAKNSTSTGKAAAFGNHDFYITKQKDTEPRAIDPWNQFIPEDPLVDFSRFLDDESLEQEDL